jgi:hypothetical protein
MNLRFSLSSLTIFSGTSFSAPASGAALSRSDFPDVTSGTMQIRAANVPEKRLTADRLTEVLPAPSAANSILKDVPLRSEGASLLGIGIKIN